MVLRADQTQVIDTWNVSGLRGTGSHDMSAADAIVPKRHSASLISDRPRHGGALYRFPIFGLLSLGVAAVALGVAQEATIALTALATGKRPMWSKKSLAHRELVQAHVAEAEGLWRSARAFLFEAAEEVTGIATARGEIGLKERALLRLAATQATRSCARAVDLMYHAGGGSSIYAASSLQRHFRDVHVATLHVMVAEATYAAVGRVLLGLGQRRRDALNERGGYFFLETARCIWQARSQASAAGLGGGASAGGAALGRGPLRGDATATVLGAAAAVAVGAALGSSLGAGRWPGVRAAALGSSGWAATVAVTAGGGAAVAVALLSVAALLDPREAVKTATAARTATTAPPATSTLVRLDLPVSIGGGAVETCGAAMGATGAASAKRSGGATTAATTISGCLGRGSWAMAASALRSMSPESSFLFCWRASSSVFLRASRENRLESS